MNFSDSEILIYMEKLLDTMGEISMRDLEVFFKEVLEIDYEGSFLLADKKATALNVIFWKGWNLQCLRLFRSFVEDKQVNVVTHLYGSYKKCQDHEVFNLPVAEDYNERVKKATWVYYEHTGSIFLDPKHSDLIYEDVHWLPISITRKEAISDDLSQAV